MRDVHIYKEGKRCHVKIDGQWWHNFEPYLIRCLLKAKGIPNAGAIVRKAPRLHVVDLNYHGKWTLNGRKISEDCLKDTFKHVGLNDEEIEAIMRIHKACYEREARRLNRQPPVPCGNIGE